MKATRHNDSIKLNFVFNQLSVYIVREAHGYYSFAFSTPDTFSFVSKFMFLTFGKQSLGYGWQQRTRYANESILK